jgi:hypothetical protein
MQRNRSLIHLTCYLREYSQDLFCGWASEILKPVENGGCFTHDFFGLSTTLLVVQDFATIHRMAQNSSVLSS